jgi:spermidine synthase
MHRDPVLYYREGLTTTISVHGTFGNHLYLKTNGKVDASHGDKITQLLVGYLPFFFHPQAKKIMVLGLGTGMTAQAAASFPVQRIDLAEIEPAILPAAEFFDRDNGHVLRDQRVKIVKADGRHAMLVSPTRYDIVISEPSNPWIAGIGNLYTRDFYRVARDRVEPDGVFAQWFHYYSMSPDDIRMVFATFGEAFPYVTLWAMKGGDFLLLGTHRPQKLDYAQFLKVHGSNATLQKDIEELGFSDPYSLFGLYRTDRTGILRFSKGAEINTDDRASLEFSAPRNIMRPTTELNRRLLEAFVSNPPIEGKDAERLVKGRDHYFLSQGYKASVSIQLALGEIALALQADQRNPDYQLLRAQLMLAQGLKGHASSAVELALSLGFSRLKEVFAIASELSDEDAEKVYRKVLTIKPSEIEAMIGLANLALSREDWKDAGLWLQKTEPLSSADPKLLLAKGRLALSRGDLPSALDLLNRSRKSGFSVPILDASLGQVYEGLGQCGKAADSYRQALRNAVRITGWRVKLAACLHKMGNAERELRKVLALSPGNEEAWKRLNGLGVKF